MSDNDMHISACDTRWMDEKSRNTKEVFESVARRRCLRFHREVNYNELVENMDVSQRPRRENLEK